MEGYVDPVFPCTSKCSKCTENVMMPSRRRFKILAAAYCGIYCGKCDPTDREYKWSVWFLTGGFPRHGEFKGDGSVLILEDTIKLECTKWDPPGWGGSS